MSGLMEIRVAETPQAVVCPAAALAGTPSAPFALVERAPGRYERRRVRVGSRSEGRAEILDGLFPGDRVVVAGVGLMAGLFPSQATRQPGGPVAGGWASAAIVAQGEVELPVGRRRFASSQVVGKVARIMAHPGDTVREGQVLAELESLALRDLQLDLLLAVSRLRWERDSVSRLRQLAEDQAAARVELWRAENELALTEQTIGEIRSKLLSLGLDAEALGRLEEGGLDARSRGEAIAPTIPVRAPADGQLAHFEIVPGQVVGPSGPDRATAATLLFEVQDRARVWVKVYVRERDAASIREGQPAEVSFPALPGVSAAGEVVRVSPVFEGAARVLPVWVEVDNNAGKLFEGMQARALLGTAPVPKLADRGGSN
jgi:cobalt-zinc-cadmium efflux system membrane fusion protein